MRYAASGMALMLAAAVSASAQTVAIPAFSPDRVRADVTFLADDLLEGREAGTRGFDLAAQFVATRFASMGLQPGAGGGKWFQPITFQENSLASPAPSVTIGGRTFAQATDVLLGASAFERKQAISAPVVFVGYGLSAPERGIDDYAGLDVRGKYVATLAGFPKGMPSDVGAHLSAEKNRVAQDHGAIGVLNIMTPSTLKVASWERRIEYAGHPSMSWINDDGRAFSTAPNIRAGASLNGAAMRALFAGAPRTLDAVLAEAEAEGGNPKGFALKPVVRINRASNYRRAQSSNVIGLLPGSDPALRNEYVVVMGHLDHEGIDRKLKGDQIYNGAMDNAVGIATMLEAARGLVSGPRPRRSILFAAVTAEEKGLLGAEYLAKHPVVGNGKVVAVVNLDMPILTYDFSDVVAYGAEHSTIGKIVDQAVAADNVKLAPDPDPAQGLFTRSDHYKFVREGVPSIYLVTGTGNGGEAAIGKFLAENYHRPSDEVSLPINWGAAAKFARINYLIARDIANAPEAPRWYANSFFGNTFAKTAPKATP